jgi:hypothetical protein
MRRSEICRGVALLLFVGLASRAAVAGKIVLDLPSIAGEQKSAVAKVLGKPVKCGASKYGEHCDYAGGTEVVYISGAADWITITPKNVPYGPAALESIGLAATKPDFASPDNLEWRSGLRETLTMVNGATLTVPLTSISVFPGGSGMTRMIYIKATTP